MSRTATISHVYATSAPAVAVVGADLDPNLVSKLYIGDKILVEANGTRIHSESLCPLVAESPWTVAENNPPSRGQRPTEENTLVLTHPQMHPLTLHYSNLLNLPKKQPAVFQENDPNLSDGAIYVILQLVSHYLPAEEVDDHFEPWDRQGVTTAMKDRDHRQVILMMWVKLLKPFRRPGWGQKSVCRIALRSFLKPHVIEAFQREDWDTIRTLSLNDLLRLHEVLHWLPCFLSQSYISAFTTTDC